VLNTIKSVKSRKRIKGHTKLSSRKSEDKCKRYPQMETFYRENRKEKKI